MDLYNKIRNAILEGREQIDERNRENKFKKDLLVAKTGKDAIDKSWRGGPEDRETYGSRKGHDYHAGSHADYDDDDGQRHSAKKSALRQYKAAGRKELSKEEAEGLEEKRGLWDNIHAKRERIKHGSGEHMRKPGSKGAPTAADFKASQNEEVEQIDEVGDTPQGKKVLSNYIKRASPKLASHAASQQTTNDITNMEYHGKKVIQRLKGINRAATKLAKEEAEQIDEMKNVPTHKLQALVKRGESDEEGMSPAFGMQIKAARNELARRKKAGIKEESEIDEAVEISHDLYVRSHGKKAKGTGGWAFGHSADAKSSELHWTQGSKNFTDAAKSAKAWAKEKGHRKIYVMPESVEETEMDNIEEGRGRPPKEGSEAWKRAQTERKKDPAEHIINRMGQASTNMTGGQHITYDDGKTHRVTNTLAAKTLAHYRGLKPAQKADFQAKIAKSHQHHLDALAGK